MTNPLSRQLTILIASNDRTECAALRISMINKLQPGRSNPNSSGVQCLTNVSTIRCQKPINIFMYVTLNYQTKPSM